MRHRGRNPVPLRQQRVASRHPRGAPGRWRRPRQLLWTGRSRLPRNRCQHRHTATAARIRRWHHVAQYDPLRAFSPGPHRQPARRQPGQRDQRQVWRRVNSRAGNTLSAINQTDLSGTFDAGGMRYLQRGHRTGQREIGARQLRRPEHQRVHGLRSARRRLRRPTTTARAWPIRIRTIPGLPGTYDAATGQFAAANIERANNPLRTSANTAAVYLLDTLHLGEQWLVNLGLRVDFSTRTPITYCPELPGAVCPRGYGGPKITEDHRSTSTDPSGQLGLVWKPVEQGSVYLSYATSATPPGSFVGEGRESNPVSITDLDAEKTRNLELGLKWNLFAERVAVSADLFQTEKTNARQLDADGSYRNIGKSRVRGVELSASGKLGNAWSVFAGYAYMQGRLVDNGFVGGESDPTKERGWPIRPRTASVSGPASNSIRDGRSPAAPSSSTTSSAASRSIRPTDC
ncbi:MAG: TonB-dependent receptor [Dokdonella sp.]